MKNYFVYILTNASNTVLYTGVTNDLQRRVYEHSVGIGSKFTQKYQCKKLVYFEDTPDITAAIAREKQIKAGSRLRKIALIESINPSWLDLVKELELLD